MNWCFNFILQFEVEKKIYYRQLLKSLLEKNIYIMFCKDPRVPTFFESLFVMRNMPKVSLLNLIASWKQ